MSQNFRDTLSDRRFAIPLIALLGVCFVGLLLLGFALILPSLRGDDEPVAEASATEEADAADAEVTTAPTSPPTETPTPRPSPTLVPIGTPVESESGQETGEPGTEVTSTAPTAPAQEEPTATATAQNEATAAPVVEDEELADTGVGWGLILASGAGLAAVVVAARRLRTAA